METPTHVKVEYIWIDSEDNLRGKTKVIYDQTIKSVTDLPIWNFDGSSTGQAIGEYSDVFLKPVRLYRDPFRKEGNLIALCECYDNFKCSEINSFNTRRKLVEIMEKVSKEEPWCGIEQEYVLLDVKSKLPHRWENEEEPGCGPQGPYYCGVGGNKSFGREFSEDHMNACIYAGINFYGLNSEVMPSQWEFQVGTSDPLTVSDDLWMARYLLYRISEKYDVEVTLHPKPKKGNWNGSGGHLNFSCKNMRGQNGIDYINDAIKKLESNHKEDIQHYGKYNDQRLSGKHETSKIDTFSSGIGDRGCSIRISKMVHYEGKGYIEDRRPASNLDPYLVLSRFLTSVFL
jgi:glutamine synthetase